MKLSRDNCTITAFDVLSSFKITFASSFCHEFNNYFCIIYLNNSKMPVTK
ncbi:hypothetical protein HanIR_Chr05g0254991 [Helianthus annuus]|nr:hypothetical protein HanIR_Chr05g0254991 [Helianthus annuus]